MCLAAEELAFSSAGGRVGNFKVRLVLVHGAKPSDDAREAIQDTDAIGYVGEIIPGQSADSLGITGQEEILQVSPTDNAVELTQHSNAVPGSPGSYIEATSTSPRTFARIVPTTTLEARALVSELSALHVSKLFVTDDGDHYGAALAAAVAQSAGSTVAVVRGRPTASAVAASGADGLLYATADTARAVRLFNAAAQSNPAVKLLGPSALNDTAFTASLSAAAQKATTLSSPGFLPAGLDASGRTFLAAFAAAYHHRPAPQAIFGYEAMAALLHVLQEAGNGANTRSTVVKDFFALRNRSSVLGTYSIDANGDTSIAPFIISRVRSGQPVPYKSVSEQG